MRASLLEVVHYHLIYFLVIWTHLHSIGYLISHCPLAFLTSSKWLTQQMMLQLLFIKCQKEYSIEDVDRLVFLQIMTSSRLFGCCRSKTWRIISRIGACQACLHLMCMFTDVCVCEIRPREVNEVCQCACPDGIAPSKVSTSNDACDDHFLLSAKSETLLSWPLSTSMYTNFA